MSAGERLAALMAVKLVAGCAGKTMTVQPEMPLTDGHYGFQQHFAEQPSSDAQRTDVGGCSGGLPVGDLAEKIYWTC